MFEGYRNVTVGRFQLTSPMSSLPPPVLLLDGPLSTFPKSVDRPLGRSVPSSHWSDLASSWSSLLQVGMPTRRMLFAVASAIGLLKWPLQPEPRMRTLASEVPVPIAAARAIVSPSANNSFTSGVLLWRK